jgi:hypothetical protein
MTSPEELPGVIKLDTIEATGVYILYYGPHPMYVGQSINVFTRIKDHRGDKAFDAVFFFPCPVEDLNKKEAFFIRKLRPLYNRGVRSTQRNPKPRGKFAHYRRSNDGSSD